MRFGHFDNQNKEYVITDPQTPLPWINYLGESEYCALISNTAGGYSFYKDPRESRILRYRYDNIPFDQGGRYLYIKDDASEEFFSPTFAPTYQKLDLYECRHGLGYTKISSECLEISTKITYFVPIEENLEIWKVEIENLKSSARELSLFSFVEFCLWDAVGDSTNFQRTWSTGKAHLEDSTIIHDTQFGYWKDIYAFFSVSEKVHSFDCQRKSFLGNNGYNNLQKPAAVVNGECSNSIAIGWSPIGSHCIKIKLKPGEKKTIIFVLGVAGQDQKDHKAQVKKFSRLETVDKELSKVKKYWEENLASFKVKTPDEDTNTSLNIWNQYQCLQTFNWSRYASYFESGIGRGMGFRDSNQDTLGFAHMIPGKVRQRILDIAAIQFEDGSTYHQYSPLTKKGDLVGYSDDALWMVYATVNYIKETGDTGILKEKVPFAKFDGKAPVGHYPHPDSTYLCQVKKRIVKGEALLDHLEAGILRIYEDRGPHGLPLSKFSDWNDCLNLLGKNHKAESVLVASMLIKASKDLVELLTFLKSPHYLPSQKLRQASASRINHYNKIISTMTKVLNKAGWDGAWFKRSFDDSQKPVGSKSSKEGKIYLEPQPWAVMSGGADPQKALSCMDSVYKLLFTSYGIKLLHPAYTRYYKELGEISTYPPGLKENASIFCHPNPWATIAECMLGRGDRAFEFYKATLPISQNEKADIRKVEPYVFCQMVASNDHPDFGEGKNSWLTGSAAWNFYAASQYLLGIRPDYEGLRIDPCIPKKWEEFSVYRKFRGTSYNIVVKNPKKVSRGVKSILVDGKKIVGNLIPIFNDRKEHKVEVYL